MTETMKFLNRPVFSLQTMLREISRNDSRILPVIPDGIYGPNTYASVRSFQEAYRLPTTGNTDHLTWQNISNIYRTWTAYPSNPSYLFPTGFLYPAQAMLAALSDVFSEIKSPEVTGDINAITTDGLKIIQNAADLRPTGLLDGATYQLLQYIFLHSITKRPAL